MSETLQIITKLNIKAFKEKMTNTLEAHKEEEEDLAMGQIVGP